jgi:hypothetical protein
MMDQVTIFESQGYAPDYINGIVNVAVKSWLKHNDIRLDEDIKIKNRGTPKKKGKTPEPKDVRDVWMKGDSRSRISISLVAYSALRPESLGNDEGDDGIVLGDFPELDIENLKITCRFPTVIVRSSISKNRREYFTILNDISVKSILEELKKRQDKGEILTPESPLIRATEGKKHGPMFVCT